MSTRWLQESFGARRTTLVMESISSSDLKVGGDDHEPFLRAGVDSLDLIQLSGYPYWHRADDTADKISPQRHEGRWRRCNREPASNEQYLQARAANYSQLICLPTRNA